MSTQVIDKPIVNSDTKRKHDWGYKVLLHNDSFNSMEYVVQTLMETVSINEPQAISIMMETHTNGIGLVTTCALEHAEFYCESLKSKGLTSTIESAE
jgi:ATP-dependent Clp protease adaptor protein ClpS